MIDLFLTKPLAAELKVETGNAVPTRNNPMFSWLGHLLASNHKKFAIFINQISFYCVMVEIAPAVDVWKAFKDRVYDSLQRELHIEESIIGQYMPNFDHLNILTLRDKKLLGKVNSIVLRLKAPLDEVASAGLPLKLAEIQVNGAPVSAKKKGKCHCATCAAQEMLKGKPKEFLPGESIPFDDASTPF